MAIKDQIMRCLALPTRSVRPGFVPPHTSRREAGPGQEAPAPHPGTDPTIVQAFIDQARWMHDHHDKRAEAFNQRASTVLTFDGVALSVLIAGLVALKTTIAFDAWIVFNVIAIVTLLLGSATSCLVALAPRKVTIPDSTQLRQQWLSLRDHGSSVTMPAQVADSLLGGDQDPVASAASDANSRGHWYLKGLSALLAALVGFAGLALQILIRQL